VAVGSECVWCRRHGTFILSVAWGTGGRGGVKGTVIHSTQVHAIRSRALLQKLLVPQLVKTLPPFFGSRKYITVFTTARHLSLFLWVVIDQIIVLLCACASRPDRDVTQEPSSVITMETGLTQSQIQRAVCRRMGIAYHIVHCLRLTRRFGRCAPLIG
jgi:hypothetical protein